MSKLGPISRPSAASSGISNSSILSSLYSMHPRYQEHIRAQPKKLNARAQRHIQRLCLGNRRMSAASIAAEVEGVWGQPVSAQTICRTLHQIGLHGCRPRRKPLLKWCTRKPANYLLKTSRLRTWITGTIWTSEKRWCQPLGGPQRKPTISDYTELTKFCHKLIILSFYNINLF